jgi:endo-1,4-beta-xylanase
MEAIFGESIVKYPNNFPNFVMCLFYCFFYNIVNSKKLRTKREAFKLNSIRSLCKEYAEYFPIGVAVNPRVIKSHAELIKKHFNSITAENEMKPGSIHALKAEYNFGQAESLVEFAQANNMQLRGHTLVWHNQTPEWFFIDKDGVPASRELALLRMKEHIDTVTTYYKGKTYCWDVVNEAIDDSASGYLRKSKWLGIVGEDFIEKAFEFAYASDPSARLFYNDYNAVLPDKCEKIYRLAKTMKDKGTPIHGIGLQGHWSVFGPTLDVIKRAIDKYASLGLELQITELDISLFPPDYKGTELKAPLVDLIKMQEEYCAKIFELFREYKDVITGVTFWGAADDVTWLNDFPVRGRKNWPLLFDDNQKPKAAFYGIIGK